MSEARIEDVLEDVRNGKPIVLVDDVSRENEGDLMVAAERVTPETIRFMMNEGRGLICISLSEERRRELGLPFQASENTSAFGTNFAVSFDHRSVARSGQTASARSKSILAAVDPLARPEDFVLPGYVFPVCAVPGGVLRRRGQTEGSVDLAKLAGLAPAGVICEIMAEDGTMLRGEGLREYCRTFDLKLTSVEAIVQWRLRHEVSLRRVKELQAGEQLHLLRSAALQGMVNAAPGVPLRVLVYADDVDDQEHLALVFGDPKPGALVRIHSECLTGDVFSSRRCDCGPQFEGALEAMLQAGSGVLVYLHQEGRGIGLGNKLRAYELQDSGLDTVDANVHLGFAVDSRSYRAGAQMLHDLGLREVSLMTNNPRKVESLEQFGIRVSRRVPLLIAADEFNRDYLEAKRQRLGHLIDESSLT